jgi:hypothetical protein
MKDHLDPKTNNSEKCSLIQPRMQVESTGGFESVQTLRRRSLQTRNNATIRHTAGWFQGVKGGRKKSIFQNVKQRRRKGYRLTFTVNNVSNAMILNTKCRPIAAGLLSGHSGNQGMRKTSEKNGPP